MPFLTKRAISLIAAGLTAVGALNAANAATLENSNFISSPTSFNGFEGIGTEFWPANTVYSEGGINVEYVGNAEIWTSFTPGIGGQGQYGWYENGGGFGYTKISMADNSDFDNVQFLAGSGYTAGTATTIAYQLLENGVIIGSGTMADSDNPMSYIGFSGTGFNEIDIQAGTASGYSFSATNFDALAIDSIAVDQAIPGGTVPEPTSLALVGAALACATFALRKKRSS